VFRIAKRSTGAQRQGGFYPTRGGDHEKCAENLMIHFLFLNINNRILSTDSVSVKGKGC